MTDLQNGHFKSKVNFLLIISVILAIGAVGYFFFLNLKRKENTKQAIGLMVHFYVAESYYLLSLGQGNYTDNAANFGPFYDKEGSFAYDDEIGKMQRTPYYGYVIESIKISQKTTTSKPSFSIILKPNIQSGFLRTGNDCFYLDQTGVIRHSGSPTKIPNANSPPVE